MVGGGGSSRGGRLKKSKDVGDGSGGNGRLNKSKTKEVRYRSSVDGRLEKSKDVGDGSMGGDVSDGSGGSLSSSFKRKVTLTKVPSVNFSDGDAEFPFRKKAVYHYRVDEAVVQEMYGLTSLAELGRLVESMREKDEDIVSPNLRFSYGVEPFNRDSDPRIGSMAILKEQALHMARVSDRAASATMLKRTRPLKTRSLRTPPWRKPDLKPRVVVANEEEKCRKMYEKLEAQEDKLLHARDLRMATTSLACFNLKFKTDYMVEQVLGSHKIQMGLLGCCYFHCNFIARSKKGLQKRFFFAEVEDAITVTLCCMLDDDVRGCHFCGDEFVHPSVEGLLTVGGN